MTSNLNQGGCSQMIIETRTQNRLISISKGLSSAVEPKYGTQICLSGFNFQSGNSEKISTTLLRSLNFWYQEVPKSTFQDG